MAPDGYFMKSITKSQKVSYAAVASTTTDWVTYDSTAKRWIDITLGTYGSYGYSTSVTSSTGSVVTKVSDTKFTTAAAFTTSAGLLNRVSSTCTKQ